MTIYSVAPAALPANAGEIESSWRTPLDWAQTQLEAPGMTSRVHDSFPAGEKYRKAGERALTLDEPGRLSLHRPTADTLTLTVLDPDPVIAAQLCDGLFRYLQAISREQCTEVCADGGRGEESVRAAESKVLTYEQQFQAEMSQPRHLITPFALTRYGMSLQSLVTRRQAQRRRETQLAGAAPTFVVLEPATPLSTKP